MQSQNIDGNARKSGANLMQAQLAPSIASDAIRLCGGGGFGMDAQDAVGEFDHRALRLIGRFAIG